MDRSLTQFMDHLIGNFVPSGIGLQYMGKHCTKTDIELDFPLTASPGTRRICLTLCEISAECARFSLPRG